MKTEKLNGLTITRATIDGKQFIEIRREGQGGFGYVVESEAELRTFLQGWNAALCLACGAIQVLNQN